MDLTIDRLTVRRGSRTTLADISLEMRDGEVIGLLGPNGAGKSTLLAAIAGMLPPASGHVLIDGRPVHTLSRRTVARRIALLEQHTDAAIPMRALDIVELGLLPHRGTFSRVDTAADARAARDALAAVGAEHLAEREWSQLSGGERQRVGIARALIQRPELLLLDEPTNHLDVGAQLDALRFVAGLGITVVAALHDLNHAAHWCDRVALLAHGRLVAVGEPRTVLTPEVIAKVYGVSSTVLDHPGDGRPVIAFDSASPTGEIS